MTIFKPLAGADDDLDENLESFARLDYPSFELLFGVADRSDPARTVAHRFAARHPELSVQIMLTDPAAAVNPKVAQLVGLERFATGEVYVISDSNVRVAPSYLLSMVRDLEDRRVGMVTSLFSGTGERNVGAALENLQLCVSTAPGLAAMNAVSRRSFSVGKSMAMRRCDLERVGGFGSVGDVLAEDYVLGRLFMNAGFVTRVASEVVENRNVACSMARTLERHTRWAKIRRSLLPFGFFLEQLLTPIVVATVGLLLAPGVATAALFGVVCVGQTVCALVAVRIFRGKTLAWYYAPLEIVRSYVALLCWIRACASRRINWRGHPFVLLRGTATAPRQRPHGSAGRARLAA